MIFKLFLQFNQQQISGPYNVGGGEINPRTKWLTTPQSPHEVQKTVGWLYLTDATMFYDL